MSDKTARWIGATGIPGSIIYLILSVGNWQGQITERLDTAIGLIRDIEDRVDALEAVLRDQKGDDESTDRSPRRGPRD
jgi:hypothetical protein